MGIKIDAISDKDERGPYPRKCYLELTCDGRMHRGFFGEPVVQRFQYGNHVKDHSEAMRAGWCERFINGERRFMCSRCSGKVKKGE